MDADCVVSMLCPFAPLSLCQVNKNYPFFPVGLSFQVKVLYWCPSVPAFKYLQYIQYKKSFDVCLYVNFGGLFGIWLSGFLKGKNLGLSRKCRLSST